MCVVYVYLGSRSSNIGGSGDLLGGLPKCVNCNMNTIKLSLDCKVFCSFLSCCLSDMLKLGPTFLLVLAPVTHV